jgi:FAD/FMN-containing dehydrogenase
MGNSNSALQQCIEEVGRNRIGFAGFPSSPLTFQGTWVRPYNLDVKLSPAAVVRPRTPEDISGVIKCANANNVKVQAKSGGHSYAFVAHDVGLRFRMGSY